MAGVNNSNTYSNSNNNINSTDLARILNIPIDQLNILLAQQIKPNKEQQSMNTQTLNSVQNTSLKLNESALINNSNLVNNSNSIATSIDQISSLQMSDITI
jgi:hypothetical protein